MNFLNGVGKSLSNYFKYDDKLNQKVVQIEETLYYLNSQILVWKNESSIDDTNYNDYFNKQHTNKYMIYNLSNRKIKFKKNTEMIVDFKVPEYPAYSLEFLLSFSISAMNWLMIDQFNILIIHDSLENPKVLIVLSTLISYLCQNTVAPMDAYSQIISTKNFFSDMNIELYKNITRYINYYGNILVNPVFDYKNVHLKTVIISGAPAIDNESDERDKKYIVINEKSYYKPILRITSNNKVVYCSYVKNKPIEPIYYSNDNCVKFDVDSLIFGETLIEILHQSKDKFKQLYLIQFNTLFLTSNILRFTKSQIDGICKDLRYPNEYFLDLIFDEDQSSNISAYEDDITKWKNVLSDFLMKNIKKNKSQENQNTKANSNNSKKEKILNDIYNEDTSELKKEHSEESSNSSNSERNSKTDSERDEDFNLSKSNTIDKAQEILQKFSKDKHSQEDEDEEDEDIDNYLKNLENKNK